ncbi:CPBP family intramembrane metalloprotease [Candidatus Micrarchaeota archaeon]|nr:CPBP family intramembrane metalloprotease [Candidatus Micrarchaeota archaeon]
MKKIFLAIFVLSIISFFLFIIFFKDTYLYNFFVQLGVFSLGAFLVWKNDLKGTLSSIGFPGSIKNTAIYFVLGMLALFTALMILSFVSLHFGFNDQVKVAEKIQGLPIYVLFIAVFLAPIAEELLFRAALIPRIGMLPSTIIFALAHFAYGSIIEILGTFLIGLLLSIIFTRSKSITPIILIHITYNLFSVLVLRLFS